MNCFEFHSALLQGLTFRRKLNVVMAQLAASSEGTQNKGSAIVAVFAITFSIAILVLATRLYIRAHVLKQLWLDDISIVVSVVRI